MTTFRSIAAMAGVDVLSYEDNATGALLRGEDRLYRIERVTLRPHVVVKDERYVDRTVRLLEKAEGVCLIGRSVDTLITLEPTVSVVGED